MDGNGRYLSFLVFVFFCENTTFHQICKKVPRQIVVVCTKIRNPQDFRSMHDIYLHLHKHGQWKLFIREPQNVL